MNQGFDPEINLIEGRNAVMEALKAGLGIDRIYIQDSDDHLLRTIAAKSRENGAAVVTCARKRLNEMSPTGVHQGVIAIAASVVYPTVGELAHAALKKGSPLIVVCDHINDPQNLGAIIRSAEAAGADGVVIPKRRGASVTPSVIRASAGAASHLPVARASNLASALDELKKLGMWVFGADAEGDTVLFDADLSRPSVIVIGSEGQGLSRLVKDKCDFTVRIPMLGKITSLNASVSASLLLYEAVRRRTGL